MGDWLSVINGWIGGHQFLVVSVVVPAISALIAWRASKLAYRSQVDTIKSQLRQQKIENKRAQLIDIRSALESFEAAAFSLTTLINNSRIVNPEGNVPRERFDQELDAVVNAMTRVRFAIPGTFPEAVQIDEAMLLTIGTFKNANGSSTVDDEKKFLSVGSALVARLQKEIDDEFKQ